MVEGVFMNRDDILKMEAGPEMDLLVAPLVDWDHSHNYNECEDDFYTYCRNCGDEPRFSERENDCEVPPRYSTNIAAAWLVMEKLRSSSHAPISIQIDAYKNVYTSWIDFDGLSTKWATSATAPLAICRTALLAMLEDV